MKKYIVEEQELKCLLQAAEMVDIIEDTLPTGLEGLVTQPEDINLSDFEQFQ